MKIYMQIANGYKSNRISRIADGNANMSKVEATKAFVDAAYGNWIRSNLGSDFTIHGITEQSFVVDFTYEDDAREFQKQLGGREMVD
ncbi:hypothetical protein AB3G45_19660 [Shinella sp. S4-D37]|uniref:hypothetical protein n=1 Tax=Shinella sp. S4-D37 TaxID=3161999 RepID=UPI00346702C6